MGRKIVLTSGKGGVGKTTVTANLGIALAIRQKSVILVDADIGLNNLDVAMEIEDRIIYDLGDVAEGRCRLRQALIQDARFPNLFTLPSAKIITDLPVRVFCAIIEELSQQNDYVIIDCPAGIDEGFHRAVKAAEEALVVTTAHIAAVRDADKVFSLLSSYSNIKKSSLIVNRLNGVLVAEGEMMDALDISRLLKVPLAGAIPEDKAINLRSVASRDNSSEAFLAYEYLADLVDGVSGKVYNCAAPYTGILGKVRGFFKRY